MGTIIAYRKGYTGKTAKVLAKALGADAIGLMAPRSRLHINPTLLICWGVGVTESVGASLNAHCFASFDKREAMRLFIRAGVLTPLLVTGEAPYGFDTIWRPRHHSGGRDAIIVPEDARVEIPEGWFGVQFMPSDKEYRIHIAGGQVIFAQRKVSEEGADPFIRSHNRGWRFVSFEPRNAEALLYASAISAVRALGLHFAAVDVIHGPYGYAVLEANSAPGLEEGSLQKYVEYFRREENRYVEREDEGRVRVAPPAAPPAWTAAVVTTNNAG